MDRIATRLPPAEYAAVVKPRPTQTDSRSRPGVVLVLSAAQDALDDHVFNFDSWSFLRERLRVFGFATAEELDTAEVRLYTGKQPYLFSRRRWESPLIDALDLNSTEN